MTSSGVGARRGLVGLTGVVVSKSQVANSSSDESSTCNGATDDDDARRRGMSSRVSFSSPSSSAARTRLEWSLRPCSLLSSEAPLSELLQELWAPPMVIKLTTSSSSSSSPYCSFRRRSASRNALRSSASAGSLSRTGGTRSFSRSSSNSPDISAPGAKASSSSTSSSVCTPPRSLLASFASEGTSSPANSNLFGALRRKPRSLTMLPSRRSMMSSSSSGRLYRSAREAHVFSRRCEEAILLSWMSNGSTLDEAGVERVKGLEGVEPTLRRFAGGGRSREMRELDSESVRVTGGEAEGVMRAGRDGPSVR